MGIEIISAAKIPLERVKSSNLAAIGHDRRREIVAVKFTNGVIYHFAPWTLAQMTEFQRAESKGRFFNLHIKGKIAGEKMTGHCGKCGAQGWIGDTCEDCGCDSYRADPRPEYREVFEPTRVLLNHDGAALGAGRAFSEQGVTSDVIFVREDGWSLGAPKRLEAEARAVWRGRWIERWQRKGTGWERTWPLPGEDASPSTGVNG